MRVPRSGLLNNLIKGARTTDVYSSGRTLFPSCRRSGNIIAAEAPPNSSAVTRDGSTR